MSGGTDTEGGRPPGLRPDMIAALLLLAALLWLVLPTLGPVWALAGLFIIALPSRREPWAGRTLALASSLLVLWAIARLQVVLAPFFTALLLAYVLDPVVDAMQRARLPRALAVAFMLLVTVILGSVTLVVLVPAALSGIGVLAAHASDLVNAGVDAVRPWLAKLPVDRADELVAEHLPQMGSWIERIGGALLDGLSSVGQGLSAAGQVVSFAIITPILLFYLLIDIDRIRAGAIDLVPTAHRGGVEAFLSELDGLLASYFRGQLLVAMITGALTGLLLALVGAPHALLLGLSTAILNLVPVIGFWIGLAVALLTTAFAAETFWPTGLFVALVYVGVQQLEGNVLSPRIVGKEVGLHPVLILLGIVLFGSLFGLVGVIVAVPLTAVTRMLTTRALTIYRSSRALAQPPTP